MLIVRNDPPAITRLFGTGLEDTDMELTHVKRGTSYTLVCVALREQDQAPLLVYKDVEEGTRWTRPLVDIFSLDENGRPKWRWNKKADKIMELIRSALDSYYLGRGDIARARASKSREGSSSP